jgi:hypothetical protein
VWVDLLPVAVASGLGLAGCAGTAYFLLSS